MKKFSWLLAMLFTLAFGSLPLATRATNHLLFTDHLVYLPAIHQLESKNTLVESVTARWYASAQCDDITSPPIPDPAIFASGMRFLDLEINVKNAKGKSYRLLWIQNGQRLIEHDLVGTVSYDIELVTSGLSSGVNGCQDIIDPGTYEFRFYLDNTLSLSGMATIK